MLMDHIFHSLLDIRRNCGNAHSNFPFLKHIICMAMLYLSVFMILLVGSGSPVYAQGPAFNRELKSILDKELQQDMVASIQVCELGSGTVLMETNPDLGLVPASTLKIVTSACALSALGPDFCYVTSVYVDGMRDTSAENLYVKGSGDPHFVTEDLFLLARAIKDRGLQEIRGSIVVDDSFFIPSKPLDENEELGIRAYHAPYSALSLNFNSLKVLAIPSGVAGNQARVILDPASQFVSLKSSVKTVEGSKSGQLEIVKNVDNLNRESISVTGSIGVGAQPSGRYVNISSPALYFGYTLKEFLQREGLKVNGGVKRSPVPDSAPPYCEYSSKPVSSIIYWLNKFSNNFMAEQICLTLGAKAYGAPGTREKGLEALKRYLVSCGVDPSSFSLSDASGLSRGNRISASAMVKVLKTAVGDFHYGPEYLASFAVSGVDGTLKEKLNDETMRRRVRAKTGTLRGISALSGFGVSREGKILVFSVIVNSSKPKGFVDQAEKITRTILNTRFEKR
mgnify:FL=1